jgi:hypothetical protein
VAGVTLDQLIGSSSAGASGNPPPVFDVTDYGAAPNGSDCTVAFMKAIAAAQGAPSNPNGLATVYVPAGTFAFTTPTPVDLAATIQIHGTVPINLIGSSSAESSLVQHVPGQALISVQVDGSTVQQLTLDCQTFEGGSCLGVSANNTLLKNATILGSRARKQFTLYYKGPLGATQSNPTFNTGNQVIDCVVNDEICDDGFSFSYQQNATISGITHFGSRLALYVCSDVTITDYTYTPNLFCNFDRITTNGFYVTPPSTNITFTNFTTNGQAGIIDGDRQQRQSSNISFTGLVMTAAAGAVPGNRMEIGNVQGLTIDSSDFTGGQMYFDAPVVTTPGAVTGSFDVVVSNTTIPAVRFAQPAGVKVQMQFNDCTFPALKIGGVPSQTFRNLSPGPTTVSIDGGTFDNQSGGFESGTTTTYTATKIAPINTALPTISGGASPGVGTVLKATDGSWIGDTPTYTQQWYRSGTLIPGATGLTYTVVSADTGQTLTITVTATNTTGTSTATSAGVAVP